MVACVLGACVFGATSPARADWLAHLPACAQPAPLRPEATTLLYPRPGLPAVARAGEPLLLRVRVPAPLTPPPGVQQEKALRGWTATLHGRGRIVAEPAEHRVPLRVVDVRPDAQATLVYRARVELPAWLAPGLYDLELATPGSPAMTRPASVRVRPARAPGPARLAPMPTPPPGEAPAAFLARLRELPVDVWLVEPPLRDRLGRALERPLRGEGVAWLDRASPALILQPGPESVLVLGGCDDPHFPFEPLRRRFAAGRRAVPVAEPPALPGAPRWEGGTYAPAGARRIVTFVVPEGGWQTALGDAQVRSVHPATPVRPAGHRPSVALVAEVEAPVTPQRSEAEAPPRRLEGPEVLRNDLAGRFRSPGPGWLALAWEEDGSGWAPADEGVDARFRWMGRQEIHGLVLDERGAAARVQAAVRVETYRVSGCAIASRTSSPAGGGAAGLAGISWLLALLGRLARKRARARPRG
ncbi:MAG: hypothetical protein CMN29_19585 [Sandaracinus sp.]|nr:hypothetical protein [Sandaracinus sp.]